jgi:hypothetical protein
LETRAWIGTTSSIEEEVVVVTGSGIDDIGVDAIALRLKDLLTLTGESDRDCLFRLGSPDAELDSTIAEWDSPEPELPGIFRRRSQGSSGRSQTTPSGGRVTSAE